MAFATMASATPVTATLSTRPDGHDRSSGASSGSGARHDSGNPRPHARSRSSLRRPPRGGARRRTRVALRRAVRAPHVSSVRVPRSLPAAGTHRVRVRRHRAERAGRSGAHGGRRRVRHSFPSTLDGRLVPSTPLRHRGRDPSVVHPHALRGPATWCALGRQRCGHAGRDPGRPSPRCARPTKTAGPHAGAADS